MRYLIIKYYNSRGVAKSKKLGGGGGLPLLVLNRHHSNAFTIQRCLLERVVAWTLVINKNLIIYSLVHLNNFN